MSTKKEDEEEQGKIIYLTRMLSIIDRNEKKAKLFFEISFRNKIKKMTTIIVITCLRTTSRASKN